MDRAELAAARRDGIIDADTEARLIAWSNAKKAATEAISDAEPEDERFTLFSGLGDIFITMGIILLGLGILFWSGAHPLFSVIGILITLGLSEHLVRRRRRVLPGIPLNILSLVFAWQIIKPLLSQIGFQPSDISGFDTGQLGLDILVNMLLVTGLAWGYYLRFKLPFAMAFAAFVSLLLVFTAFAVLTGSREIDHYRVLGLVCGIAIFTMAVGIDMTDPQRTSRRSDLAFWLHLIAAPIVTAAILGPSLQTSGLAGQAVIFAMFIILTLISLVLDRRSPMVSALIYVGYAMADAFATLGLDGFDSNLTVLLLGAFIIAIGLGWRHVRHMVLKLVPYESLRLRLPPDRIA